jgi:CheY-like chemotaxis protein
MRTTSSNPVATITGSLRVLIVEDNPYLRKLIRNLLVNVGVKKIDEGTDGLAGFEAIKNLDPDIVILDWDLRRLNGAELVRIIRTPACWQPSTCRSFGTSAELRPIAEAKRLGVNACWSCRFRPRPCSTGSSRSLRNRAARSSPKAVSPRPRSSRSDCHAAPDRPIWSSRIMAADSHP